jgi:hypothetical protein
MIIQVLPQAFFEIETKTVAVMEKATGVEDNIKEKEGKENKAGSVNNFNFTSITDDPAHPLHYHAPLILPPAKDVTTPPPNFC